MAAANAVVMLGRAVAAKQGVKKGASVLYKGGKGIPKPGTKFKSLSNIRAKDETGLGAFADAMAKAFAKATAPKPEKPPTLWQKLGANKKQMAEAIGALGIASKLKSFGDSTLGAAADLESSRIGFDFLTSKLKGSGAGAKGKGKGPASAKELERSFADYWTALRENAQTTAFSASDVLAGGMKAIKLTKGDTKQAMQLVKLAEDMAAFNPGKSVKEAMEALSAAKTNDYSKMKEFGLEFKKGSWNKFLKTADAWFQGGGDKLNASANGMWEIVTEGLKGSLQNAGVAALEQVKPVMQRLVAWLTNGGFKKLESLAAKTVDVFVKSFLWMMDVLGPVFGWLENALDWIGANFDSLRPILNGLIAAFAAFAVISTVMSVISGIGTAVALLSNPIFWVVAAIGLLTAAWTGNWLGIRDKTASAIAWIVSSYRSLKAGIERFVQEAKQLFADLGAWFEYVGTEVAAAGERIAAWAGRTWSEIAAATTAALGKAWQAVNGAYQRAKAVVVGALTEIYDFHALVWNGIATIVGAAGSFLANAVSSAFGTIGGIVSDAIDTILRIGRAGMELLRGLFAGVWKGAAGDHAGAVRTIQQAFQTAFGKVSALLSGFADRAKDAAANFVLGYASGLAGFAQTVVAAVTPIANRIASVWSAVSDVAVAAGKRIAAGFFAFVDAIRQGAAWIDRTLTQLKIDVLLFGLRIGLAFAAYVQDLGRRIAEGARNLLNAAILAFRRGMDAIGTYLTDKMKEIETAFWAAADRIAAAFVAGLDALIAWGRNAMQSLWAAISPALQAIGEFSALMWGIVIGAFFWGLRIVSDAMTGFVDSALSFGERFMLNLIAGFEQLKGALLQKVSDIWDSVASIFGGTTAKVNLAVVPVHGSHRTGLARVPFDGYIAQLHRGEMVLTSEQADRYRGGQLSSEQRSAMLQPYGAAGAAPTSTTKSVAISNLIGEMHVHDEADENRFIEKLKRMLEEDLLTEGEGVYAG
ncbi:hypothetical protein FE782_12580 [Paenibacillus antri]|uniref:Phage tail tape measure protein n=1 Tax=Paenibacillus antri TaxID=2582848 RepID=A0A5R9GBQ7_9BACL|nr:hypothetical protein [Paenibacillus antri]TLS51746.1 hypothetical protein FE782_12580 [Paenibacillus antri]